MKYLLELIKKYEGCHKRQADGTLIAYKCPAGVWTIGWGTTGRYVREGTVWTQEKADERLVKDAQTAIDAALKASPILAKASEYKLAAIADFIYNLGIGNYQSSTLKKRVDAGNWLEASQEIRRWNKAGGKVLAGLTARREDEAKLILKS
jgi:lysozyme